MSSWRLAVALLFCGWMSACSLLGQDVTPAQPPAKPESTQSSKPVESDPAPTGNGKVLFSRSSDDTKAGEKGADEKIAAPSSKQGSAGGADSVQPNAEERDSLTFLDYDLDVRLTPKQQALAVRAQITVRNDGEKPLKRVALQLSSDLRWDQIRAGAANLTYVEHLVDDDADHTGAVNEALVTLPRELAPKEKLKLEVFYSGKVPLTAARLERIGAPAPTAEKSDWDQISPEFTGTRGFGNVVWYPMSAPPRLLGDGATLFAEIGRQKLRQEQASISITVTAEFPADPGAPNLAVLNGHVVPVTQTAVPENSYPGVVTATLPRTTLGFATPSLFLLSRQKVDDAETVDTTGSQVFVSPDDLVSAQSFWTAVNKVAPLIQQWLGAKPQTPLTVVGLNDPGDTPAEEKAVFFTGIKASSDPKAVQDTMAHSLAHAYFSSPRVWLDEGVPQFLGSLWIEQTEGRQAALDALGAARGALALAEPGTPGEAGGQSLIHASDTVYYRVKAAYVLWMLRDLTSDAALSAALRAYVPAEDTTPEYFERLLEKASGPTPKDLKWFFDSWVYNDRGLPDVSITGAFPGKATEGQWLVALDIANDGYAEAEVPVTLRAKGTTVTERLRLPARSKVSRRMLIQGTPTEVQVNDGTVPEVRESIHIKTLTSEAQ